VICRIWHGWTSHENAGAYERLLRTEVFHGISNRKIAGYRGIELMRREDREVTEFVTVMCFESMEAVQAFAGQDYEAAVVPPAARALLQRFDERSEHYGVRQPRGESLSVGEGQDAR
jgi:heme-degrading monooxygenase HmoA